MSSIARLIARRIAAPVAVLLCAVSAIAAPASTPDEETYLTWLKGQNEKDRRYAEMYLMRSTNSMDAVVSILNDESQPATVRAAAAETLGFIGVEAGGSIKDLVKILHDRKNDPLLRIFAETAITYIGGVEAKAAVPELALSLTDSHVLVRHFAALGLQSIGDAASSAVPQIKTALESEADEVVFYQIAEAVGKIGPQAKPTLPILRKRLSDGRQMERLGAADGIGGLKAEAIDAVNDLQRTLKEDSNPPVRSAAATSLSAIGAAAQVDFAQLTDSLVKAMHGDKIATVRRAAAEGLETLGARSVPSIPALTKSLADPDDDVQHASSKALLAIAKDINRTAAAYTRSQLQAHIRDLEKSASVLSANSDADQRYIGSGLQGEIEVMRETSAGRWLEAIGDFVAHNYLWLLFACYVPAMLIIWWLVTRFWPIAILNINEAIAPLEIKMPERLGGFKLPLRSLLLVSCFNYHSRVLDAWVDRHAENVDREFIAKPTVAARANYLSMPVSVGRSGAIAAVPAELTPEAGWEAFSSGRGCIVIEGQGGAGKTSLACRIAKWGLWREAKLCRHKMLPILIEHEVVERKDDLDPLMEAARGQLQSMLLADEDLSPEMFRWLAKRQRVLVIVDHFSELSDPARAMLQPAKPQFALNALIVTSRIREDLAGLNRTVVSPTLVRGDKLSNFIDRYLAAKGVRELLNDKEFFDACTRLSVAIGNGRVTLLLARMFADLVVGAIGSQQQESADTTSLLEALPDNVPDMMIAYVRELNRLPAGPFCDTNALCAHLRAIAWECIWNGHCPAPALRQNAQNAIDCLDANKRLEYLEQKLQIVQSVDSAGTLVRFTLDPVAEYFAALRCCEVFGTDSQQWDELISAHAKKDSTRSRGFRCALKDCCRVKSKQIEATGGDPRMLTGIIRRLDEFEPNETRTAA